MKKKVLWSSRGFFSHRGAAACASIDFERMFDYSRFAKSSDGFDQVSCVVARELFLFVWNQRYTGFFKLF